MPKEKLLINETVRPIDFTFRWTGINLESRARTPIENFKLKLRLTINFIGTVLLWCPLVVWWFITGFEDGIGLTIITNNAPSILSYFFVLIRAIFFFTNDKQLNYMMANLKDLEKKENDRERVDEINGMIKNNLKFVTLLVKVQNLFNSSLLILGLVYPLIAYTVLTYYYGNHGLKLPLVFPATYPFDASNNMRIWPLIYVHQMWTLVVEMLLHTGTDYLFHISCTYICIHFKLLKYDIENVIPANVQKANICQNEELKSKLAELVTRHQQILRTVELLEEIYTKSNLFNFVTRSFLICLIVFDIVAYNGNTGKAVLCSVLVKASVHMFLLCYFGDMLSTASVEITDAVYNCNWYLANKSITKILMIIQMRAQKASKLTAGGYVDIDVPAFTAIMNTAWSYFSLLNTLYSIE